MKKIFATVLAAVMIVSRIFGSDYESVNGVTYVYSIENGKATLGSEYTAAVSKSTFGELVIPSRLGGCPVTTIGRNAFWGCKSLRSITIPEGVTTIGENAFVGCSSLTSITIPNSVTTIGNGAFGECKALKSITIPEGVTTIGKWAFSECKALTSITLPEGVEIEGGVFSGCSSLSSITIPEGSSIGAGAFYQCFSLIEVTLPEGMTTIEDRLFRGCSSLSSITIPSGVTKIGGQAFAGCASLKSITIPKSVKTIGKESLEWCYVLRDIYVEPGDAERVRRLLTENRALHASSLAKVSFHDSAAKTRGGESGNSTVSVASRHGIGLRVAGVVALVAGAVCIILIRRKKCRKAER